jgi:ribosome-binding factor A
MRRVDEALREVLSDAITRGLKDPRIGFITVSSVDASPDIRHARVYVSVLGTEKERSRSLQGLQAAHGYLQRRVSSELHLKHTPTLEFVYDDTVEKGMRIEELLKEGGARDDDQREM